jgi:hypothetical protein
MCFRAFSAILHSRWIRGYDLLIRAYNAWQRLRGAAPYPQVAGTLDGKTPVAATELRAGDLVRVRELPEIEATLDRRNRNRGLLFDPEMTPFCGETHRVQAKIKQIINERTGEMMALEDSWILDGVVCEARYSDRRIACPRAIPAYWRTCWLERIEAPPPRK